MPASRDAYGNFILDEIYEQLPYTVQKEISMVTYWAQQNAPDDQTFPTLNLRPGTWTLTYPVELGVSGPEIPLTVSTLYVMQTGSEDVIFDNTRLLIKELAHSLTDDELGPESRDKYEAFHRLLTTELELAEQLKEVLDG